MNSLKFYRNKNDKNNFIASNGDLVKEGEYIELKPNSIDLISEKHVPIYEVVGDKIKVSIESTIHPMSDEHYIMWIALVNDNDIKMVKLKPSDNPIATFPYINESEIYAYCNLHSLWKNNVD
ncbi:MAG: desulfoferrodoxin [Bacilli bacterium]|nr:desulfoferrodoxin [Bacilli bacterium]